MNKEGMMILKSRRRQAVRATNTCVVVAVPQVRDEYRTDYDVGRGGFGKIIQMQKANHQPAIY